MQLTYLGHAGFCIETQKALLIMDPWLSSHGAFDAAWFQYPKNHDFANYVQQLLSCSKKDNYIYISHEHRDHFDIDFLQSLSIRNFTFLLADFSYPSIKMELENLHYVCQKIILLKDNEPLYLQDTEIRLFLVDTELNCDSAILIKHESYSFLNLNDCKIYDRLPNIVHEHGNVDILTAQFSGASWHPTCYQMPLAQYEEICINKITNKFSTIANVIQSIQPKIYFPSAGPVCFLDPLLQHIHLQPINAYPRAPQLLAYLRKYHHDLLSTTQYLEIFPGDKINFATLILQQSLINRVAEENFSQYLINYAQEYTELFSQRTQENQCIDSQDVFAQLYIALEHKVAQLTALNQQVKTLLYWQLEEIPEKMICVDLANKCLKISNTIADINNYYRITTAAWQVNKVLNGAITWSDFALLLRVTIERVPDVYDTILHGFLILDINKIRSFCKKMASIDAQTERITIAVHGKQYSIARYCPHQGADLSQGYLDGSCWVCPVHQWRFDLNHSGQCTKNLTTINSIRVFA